MPTRKNKTRKIRKEDKTLIGFDNIPKTMKTIWAIDQFGKRKVVDIEKYIIRSHIDSMGLATDYNPKSEKYKQASTEIKRRLLLQLKESPSSRRLYTKKTRKKYSKKNIDKESISMNRNFSVKLMSSAYEFNQGGSHPSR